MEVQYAGFWRRAGALGIDLLILLPGAIVIEAVFLLVHFGGRISSHALVPLVRMANLLLFWLYFALMESGPRQATPGKRLLGLKVTGLDGAPITFGRATGCFFGKLLSGFILYIGFIMAAFTERRQGLHDLMARTLVLREDPGPPLAIPPAGR